MRNHFFHIVFILCLLLLGTSSCSWLPSWFPFSEKGDELKVEGNCQMEGVLLLKGTAPHQVPVLQNEEGRWHLTGQKIKKLKKFDNETIRVQGQCMPSPPDQSFLLPEIRIIKIIPLGD